MIKFLHLFYFADADTHTGCMLHSFSFIRYLYSYVQTCNSILKRYIKQNYQFSYQNQHDIVIEFVKKKIDRFHW